MSQPSLNIDHLYRKCLSEGTKERINARTIYNYCVSPFIVYCDNFEPQDKKDPQTEYDRLVFEQGNLHENQVIATKFPGVKKVAYKTPEEGFKLLLEKMKKGIAVLCGTPVFYLPEGLSGVFDVLERRNGQNSIFGNYHYIVKEIKLARNIQKRHIYQTAFYNYMLGKIQGYTPPTFYLINRDYEESEEEYNETRLLEMLTDIREILSGKKVSPTYGACKGTSWETYNDEEAKKTKDVSLVSGVGQSFKVKLLEKEIRTVADLAQTPREELVTISGIGDKEAENFLNNSKAIVNEKHICIGSCQFPKKATEIFLDLEGTSEQVSEEELISIDYLIGVIVRKNGTEEYKPFLAHNVGQEGEMFRQFVKWVLEQKDFIIYHWHNYERNHLQRLAQRYNLPKEEADMIFTSMRDIYKDATSSFAFPTYGNGLKEVATYIGYEWKHKEVNALESIALYFQYVQDPVTNKDKLKKVLDYNKDDCMATMLIKDWLERESKD
jgi:predicted RecB family nuclease